MLKPVHAAVRENDMDKVTLERLVGWDESLCLHFNRASRWSGVGSVLRIVSRLGDGIFWYALMVTLLLAHRDKALLPVAHMLVTGVLGVIVYKWLKIRITRPRPYQINQNITLAMAPLDQFSFPSGHTLHAVSLTIVTLSHFPMLGALLIPFALLVALSRPILGLHYPSDVVAGAVLGGTIAAIVLNLF
jgi:undecaprenyl-diphosphatase